MRILSVFAILALLLSGCLKNDVLDEDLLGTNFQESEFYTSGDFESEFSLSVDDIEVLEVVNSQNDTLCKPIITFRLEDEYAARLAQHWSHEIRILFEQGFQEDWVGYGLTADYTTPFVYDKHKAIDCDGIIELRYRIELIAPETGRVSANAEKKSSIPMP